MKLDELSESIDGVARAIYALGNGNASTPMGGLEAHGKILAESLSSFAASTEDITDAIRSAGEDIRAGLESVAKSIGHLTKCGRVSDS